MDGHKADASSFMTSVSSAAHGTIMKINKPTAVCVFNIKCFLQVSYKHFYEMLA